MHFFFFFFCGPGPGNAKFPVGCDDAPQETQPRRLMCGVVALHLSMRRAGGPAVRERYRLTESGAALAILTLPSLGHLSGQVAHLGPWHACGLRDREDVR